MVTSNCKKKHQKHAHIHVLRDTRVYPFTQRKIAGKNSERLSRSDSLLTYKIFANTKQSKLYLTTTIIKLNKNEHAMWPDHVTVYS